MEIRLENYTLTIQIRHENKTANETKKRIQYGTHNKNVKRRHTLRYAQKETHRRRCIKDNYMISLMNLLIDSFDLDNNV